MTNNKNNLNGYFWPTMQTAIFVIVALMLFTSCATRKVVEYRDRDVNHYITNTVHDTLIDKTTDSVYFEVRVKGDTVYNTKYVEHTRWRDRIVVSRDTCWRDSVSVQKIETTKEVKTIPKLFRLSMGFSILVIVFILIRIVKWLQKH